MALTNRFKISMLDVFPHGAYLVSEVEPVRDFDKSSAGRPVQAVDKESGLPVWAVSVLDADPEARRSDKTVTVKIAATYQPVPPEAAAGLPFRPVEFDGLTVTPYVNESGGRGAGGLQPARERDARPAAPPQPRAARPSSGGVGTGTAARTRPDPLLHRTGREWAEGSTAATGSPPDLPKHPLRPARHARTRKDHRLDDHPPHDHHPQPQPSAEPHRRPGPLRCLGRAGLAVAGRVSRRGPGPY